MTNTPTTFFGWIIFLIQQYHGYYLQGLLTTLETSLAGTICGCFLGFPGWNHPGNGHPGAG